MPGRSNLSVSEFPLPVVIVVGDLSEEFVVKAWAGVVRLHAKRSRARSSGKSAILWEHLEPLLEGSRPEIIEALNEKGWGHTRRPRAPQAVPLQLGHPTGEASQVSDNLRKILDLFDVWGIIAAGRAGDVEPVRDALKGIDIPLLVTTDSTVGTASVARNELRLMPSNRAQAMALLFAAVSHSPDDNALRGESEQGARLDKPDSYDTPIMCVYQDGIASAQYVKDLKKQLEDTARRLKITLTDYRPRKDVGPLIAVGYQPLAEQLIKDRTRGRLTILSDGCATDTVRSSIWSERNQEAWWWFLSRAEVTFEYLAEESFAAITKVVSEAQGASGRSARARGPTGSLRDAIRDLLSGTGGFEFEGIENIAPSYEMRCAGDQTQWPETEPEPPDVERDAEVENVVQLDTARKGA
jgi:hypothetical protein